MNGIGLLMPPRRIIFTGDFMRPSAGGVRPTQHFNIQWLHDLLRWQLSEVTQLPSEIVAWNCDSVTRGGIDKHDIDRIYGSLGLGCSIDSWAALYHCNSLPESLEILIADMFGDAIVVGFELPPYIEGVLKKYDIPFVDVIIHPIRFLDDIYFGVRTSKTDSQILLSSFAVPGVNIEAMASIQSAAARRQLDFVPTPNSALVLLQTRFDRTQIRDGEFISIADFLPEICGLSKIFTKLYVKPHPYDIFNSNAELLGNAFSNVEITRVNIYSLFASDGISHVTSVSSGSNLEAGYFRKTGKYLYKAPNQFADSDSVPENDEFVGVYDDFLNTCFWASILSPIVNIKNSFRKARICFKPNRLRNSLRSYWSFNEIDTDYIVNLADNRR